MLPIARNNTIHVPHGLAAVAAIVCLVISFTADFGQGPENLLKAQTESPTPVAVTVDDSLIEPAPTREGKKRDSTSSGQAAVWIPWFPGLRSGGG